MASTTEIGVNRCIYCGATRYNAKRADLAAEHVIPLSLDGHLIIPNASCHACERAINRFETPCNRDIFGPVRYYLGLSTRNPKSRPEQLPVILTYKSGRKKVVNIPVSQRPTVMVLETFEPPEFLRFLSEVGSQAFFIFPDGWEGFNLRNEGIANSWNAIGCRTNSSFHPWRFARLLAKIAYGYAVSVAGLDGFEPCLLDYILKGSDKIPRKYIGCDHRPLPEPRGLHELSLGSVVYEGATLLVVRVRLFSYLLAPEYIVAVGRLNPGESIPISHYIEPGPELPRGSINAHVEIVRPSPDHPG